MSADSGVRSTDSGRRSAMAAARSSSRWRSWSMGPVSASASTRWCSPTMLLVTPERSTGRGAVAVTWSVSRSRWSCSAERSTRPGMLRTSDRNVSTSSWSARRSVLEVSDCRATASRTSARAEVTGVRSTSGTSGAASGRASARSISIRRASTAPSSCIVCSERRTSSVSMSMASADPRTRSTWEERPTSRRSIRSWNRASIPAMRSVTSSPLPLSVPHSVMTRLPPLACSGRVRRCPDESLPARPRCAA